MNNINIIDEREVLGFDFKVYGDVDNPLFLAKDVANWIEHNKPSEMILNGKFLQQNGENTYDIHVKLLRHVTELVYQTELIV